METLFSGFEVCKAVRSDDDLKDIPIIGISAMADELEIKRIWDEFVELPWRLRELPGK